MISVNRAIRSRLSLLHKFSLQCIATLRHDETIETATKTTTLLPILEPLLQKHQNNHHHYHPHERTRSSSQKRREKSPDNSSYSIQKFSILPLFALDETSHSSSSLSSSSSLDDKIKISSPDDSQQQQHQLLFNDFLKVSLVKNSTFFSSFTIPAVIPVDSHSNNSNNNNNNANNTRFFDPASRAVSENNYIAAGFRLFFSARRAFEREKQQGRTFVVGQFEQVQEQREKTRREEMKLQRQELISQKKIDNDEKVVLQQHSSAENRDDKQEEKGEETSNSTSKSTTSAAAAEENNNTRQLWVSFQQLAIPLPVPIQETLIRYHNRNRRRDDDENENEKNSSSSSSSSSTTTTKSKSTYNHHDAWKRKFRHAFGKYANIKSSVSSSSSSSLSSVEKTAITLDMLPALWWFYCWLHRNHSVRWFVKLGLLFNNNNNHKIKSNIKQKAQKQHQQAKRKRRSKHATMSSTYFITERARTADSLSSSSSSSNNFPNKKTGKSVRKLSTSKRRNKSRRAGRGQGGHAFVMARLARHFSFLDAVQLRALVWHFRVFLLYLDGAKFNEVSFSTSYRPSSNQFPLLTDNENNNDKNDANFTSSSSSSSSENRKRSDNKRSFSLPCHSSVLLPRDVYESELNVWREWRLLFGFFPSVALKAAFIASGLPKWNSDSNNNNSRGEEENDDEINASHHDNENEAEELQRQQNNSHNNIKGADVLLNFVAKSSVANLSLLSSSSSSKSIINKRNENDRVVVIKLSPTVSLPCGTITGENNFPSYCVSSSIEEVAESSELLFSSSFNRQNNEQQTEISELADESAKINQLLTSPLSLADRIQTENRSGFWTYRGLLPALSPFLFFQNFSVPQRLASRRWDALLGTERRLFDSSLEIHRASGERRSRPYFQFLREKLRIAKAEGRLSKKQKHGLNIGEVSAEARREWEGMHPYEQAQYFDLVQIEEAFPDFVGFHETDVDDAWRVVNPHRSRRQRTMAMLMRRRRSHLFSKSNNNKDRFGDDDDGGEVGENENDEMICSRIEDAEDEDEILQQLDEMGNEYFEDEEDRRGDEKRSQYLLKLLRNV